MGRLTVVALCAEWCGVCRDFRSLWDAQDFTKTPGVSCHWVDIEDQEDLTGDLVLETFPTLAVFSDNEPVFFGPIHPNMDMLLRISQAPAAQRFDAEIRTALATLYAGVVSDA